MIYTGGFFDGVGFIEAFSNSDASEGLAMGSFFGLLCTIIIYLARKILTFEECMACVPEGFKAMVPAILILTFAWTLKAMTDSLGAAVYVADLMESCAGSLMNLLPAFIFLVGCFLSFATGTSWGTFGILIPIVVSVFANSNHELMVISISACMAGPLLPDFRYDDHGLCGSAVQPCQPCFHPAALCGYGGGGILCHVPDRGLCPDPVDLPSGRAGPSVRGTVWNPLYWRLFCQEIVGGGCVSMEMNCVFMEMCWLFT